jgi:hypothetical protein
VDALTRHRLAFLGLVPSEVEALPLAERLEAVLRAFLARIPYETLSKHERYRMHPAEPERWMRTTDRLLRDAASDGLGGTCFSMAYALADLFRGCGANAHTALGHHILKEEPHAAVVAYLQDGPRLYDASFFVPAGVPVRPDASVSDALFTFVLEARAKNGCLLTLVQHETAAGGESRPLFSMIPMPAPPDAFRRAWLETFPRDRDKPLALARRVGDELRWYGEDREHVEVISPAGRRRSDVGTDPPVSLSALFGVKVERLRAHFAAVGPALAS